jgi:hypothetical protein
VRKFFLLSGKIFLLFASQILLAETPKMMVLTFSVVTSVIGVRPAINRRANELRRIHPA